MQYTAAMPADIAAEVIANTRLSDDYNVLALAAPAIAAAAAPGQFVMVKAATGHDPLLRRPFSVFEVLRDAAGAPIGISLLNKRIGVSTGSDLRRAAGRARRLPRTARPPVLARRSADRGLDGGRRRRPGAVRRAGRGAAPRAASRRRCSTARGERPSSSTSTRSATWASSSCSRPRTAAPASADASSRRSNAGSRHAPPDAPVMIYACGPEGMLAATAKTAARFGRPCQVSVERIMGCGLGGCYSCVVPMRDEHGALPSRAIVPRRPGAGGRSDRVGLTSTPWIFPFASAR